MDVQWRDMSELDGDVVWPDGYSVSELCEHEVDDLIVKVISWSKNGVYGEANRYICRKFYCDEVFSNGKLGLYSRVYIGRFKGEIVCMFCLEYNQPTATLYGRFGIVAPDHQRGGIGLATMRVIDFQAISLGCSVIMSYATLWHKNVQRLLEQCHYRAVGVFPGRDLEFDTEKGKPVRVYEVLYVKNLDLGDEMAVPSQENMTIAVQELYGAIFPEASMPDANTALADRNR